jgi:deazaflavin-dependent oxidoreductase (nitroreductase family)
MMIETKVITPPEPIPYPQNKVLKKLYRIPILLFRLGLSKIFSKYILILSTYGRKTGKVHHTPIEYFQHQGRFYVMSGFGTKPDWFKNILADPNVTLQINQKVLHLIARKPETESEWDAVVAFLKSSPMAELTEKDSLNTLDKPEVRDAIKTWPVLTFDATEEACPTSLETDLLWCWPLILTGTALALFIWWLCQSKDKKFLCVR